jgi:hypothetical protein
MRWSKVRTPGVLPPEPLVVLPVVDPVVALAVVDPPAPEAPEVAQVSTVGSQRACPAFAPHAAKPSSVAEATTDEATEETHR